MVTKDLKFTLNSMTINNSVFDSSNFTRVDSEDFEKVEINHRTGITETLSVSKISRINEGEYIFLYFLEGGKYPYSKTVINESLEECENPRNPNEIELDHQLFVLIDIKKQRVYLSDQKKRARLANWLKDKLDVDVSISSIIDEKEFIDKLKSIDKICFTIEPNLLNYANEDILSHKLVEDINGYDAKRAQLNLYYGNNGISSNAINKLKSLLGRKNDFEKITVIGRNDENLESVFNIGEIVNKLTIQIEVDDNTRLCDQHIVFNELLSKVKNI